MSDFRELDRGQSSLVEARTRAWPRRAVARLAVPGLVLALSALALSACGSSHGSTASDAASQGKSASTPSSSSTKTTPAPLPAQSPQTVVLPGGAKGSQTVASVGSAPISAAQLARLMYVKRTDAPVPDPPKYAACIAGLRAGKPSLTPPVTGAGEAQLKGICKERYQRQLTNALDAAMHNLWMLGEAKEQGIKVSAREVDQEIEEAKKSFHTNAEWQAYLKGNSQTIGEVRLESKINHISNAIFRRLRTNSGEAGAGARAARYYATHRRQFTEPEGRNVRIVRTATAASAARAISELRSGKSFASVAGELSAIGQPVKANHGEVLDLKPETYQEPALAKAIFSAKLNRLYGPIAVSAAHLTIAPETNSGYFIFEVRKVIPPHLTPLSQVKGTLAEQLSEAQRKKTVSSFVKAFRLKWTQRTDCRPGFVVRFCRQFKPSKSEEAAEEDLFSL